jgi:hypothetical protein
MPVEKPKSKCIGGRQHKEIDEVLLKNLCKIQCTDAEICAVMMVDQDTLFKFVKAKYNIPLSEYIKQHSAHGKVSLRRLQFKKAEEGNTAMLIWLGKQYLGQRDEAIVTSQQAQTFTLKYDTKQALINEAIKHAKEQNDTIDIESEPLSAEPLPSRTILRKKTDVINV